MSDSFSPLTNGSREEPGDRTLHPERKERRRRTEEVHRERPGVGVLHGRREGDPQDEWSAARGHRGDGEWRRRVRLRPPAPMAVSSSPDRFLLLQVLPQVEDTKISLTYKYIIHEDLLPLITNNNVLLAELDTYEWALKSWSQCSKPCGGGLSACQVRSVDPNTSRLPLWMRRQDELGWFKFNAKKKTLVQTKCIETNHQLSHSRSAVHQIWLQEEEWQPPGAPQLLRNQQKAQTHTQALQHPRVQSAHVSRRSCTDSPTHWSGGVNHTEESDCVLRWVVEEWSPCSKTCGKLGYQTRAVQCMQALHNGTNKAVHSKHCTQDRPETRRACNHTACPAQWRTGAWSQVRDGGAQLIRVSRSLFFIQYSSGAASDY